MPSSAPLLPSSTVAMTESNLMARFIFLLLSEICQVIQPLPNIQALLGNEEFSVSQMKDMVLQKQMSMLASCCRTLERTNKQKYNI